MRRTSPEADVTRRSTADRQPRHRSRDSATNRGRPIETLHRRVGNQAVQALHERGDLQAKLEVSSPRDPAEREAERVADEVMRMSTSENGPRTRGSVENRESAGSTVAGESLERRADERLQRLCSECTDRLDAGKPLNCPECEAELGDEVAIQRDVSSVDAGASRVDGASGRTIQAARSGGRPLPDSTRSFFEPRFGTDFSNVRVHTGPRADRAARSVNASAFTLGSDVVFRSGAYQPASRSGRQLLAHELTHVVQQGEGAPQIQRKLDDSYRDVHLPRQIACLIDKHEGPVDWIGNNMPFIGNDYDDRQDQCRGISGYSGPDVPRDEIFGRDNPWMAVAENLKVGNPDWLESIPSCPFHVAAADVIEKFEDKTHILSGYFHQGAEWDYRSKIQYTEGGNPHSQQCCYDEDGRLIAEGEGAGTPDYYAPEHSLVDHNRVDVKSFNELGWQVYFDYWEPDGSYYPDQFLSDVEDDEQEHPDSPPYDDPTRPPMPGAGTGGRVP